MEVNMELGYVVGGLFIAIVSAAFGWLWVGHTDNRKEIRSLENDTYRKSETIEHIVLRVDPLQKKVDDMHRDVKEIKNHLMRK